MFQRKAGLAVALLGAAFVGALTLGPLPGREALVRATPLWCLVCGELGGVDVLLNVLLFAPLGIGLGLLGVRPGRAFLLAAALSLSVELLQLKVVAGRDASLSDLLTNSAGVLLGHRLGHSWRGWVLPDPSTARRLVAAWAVTWLALGMGTAAALRPVPTHDRWYGQWAPELGHLEKFEGRVCAVRLGDIALPSWRLTDSVDWAQRLVSDTVRLRADANLGPATPGLAPIASIFDEHQREIMLLGQWGSDAVIRVRMTPSLLRLRPWAMRLPGGLAQPPGTPVSIEAGIEDRAYVIRVHSEGATRARVLPFSPQWTWAALLPVDYAFGRETGVVTALWLAAMLSPLGWWAGRARGRIPVLAGVVLVAGIAGIRMLFGLSPAPPAEWIGALGGLGVGLLLAHGVRVPHVAAIDPAELRNPAVDR
ncbi:MAG: VanZ family protein [Gemmatimonadales bacterium]